MKKSLLVAIAATAGIVSVNQAQAQDEVFVQEESITVTDFTPCKTHYYTNGGDNWFIQFGAGINSPFVENKLTTGDAKRRITAAYNVGFGRWFSPYLGWRIDFQGAKVRWDNDAKSSAKYVNANADLMWDMFNTCHGVNPDRVFSLIPFVGVGGTFMWDFDAPASVIYKSDGKVKQNSWTLPVSAGIQARFRVSKYVDFFVEGRAQFYADNFNNAAYGEPIDANLSAIGGFNVTFGGRDYKSFNACDYTAYIASLNNQVNDMRGALATTAAALAVAESQLPCPTVVATAAPVIVEAAPLMATVRFTINSARISKEEKVNVYNVAQWMNDNPDQNVVIMGYADKETGTSAYNMTLSQKRAQAVNDMLVKEYGIDQARLTTQANGSDTQPYDVNNWNRIVIFSVAE